MLMNDGSCLFVDNNNHDIVLFTLKQQSTGCHCRFWKAYHLQCPRLLLVHNGFCDNLCSKRWLQLSGLVTSVGDGRQNLEHATEDGIGAENLSTYTNSGFAAAAVSGVPIGAGLGRNTEGELNSDHVSKENGFVIS